MADRVSPAFQMDVRPPSGALFSQAARPSTVPTASVELAFLFLELPAEVVLHVERLLAVHPSLLGTLLLMPQVLAQQLVEQLRYIQQPTHELSKHPELVSVVIFLDYSHLSPAVNAGDRCLSRHLTQLRRWHRASGGP